MATFRVPGARNYTGETSGLAQVAQSSKMQTEMLGLARQLAGDAAAVGRSEYEAAPMTVVTKTGEKRAGAVVYEAVRHWDDVHNEILNRVAQRMRLRMEGRS